MQEPGIVTIHPRIGDRVTFAGRTRGMHYVTVTELWEDQGLPGFTGTDLYPTGDPERDTRWAFCDQIVRILGHGE